MTSVVVCGLAGQQPVAGMGLHYLQYCLGFRDLGLDVLYLEDHGGWPSHPTEGAYDEHASYTVAWLMNTFDSFGLDWSYRDPLEHYHGIPLPEVLERCAGADLLLNVSSSHILEPHHLRAKVTACVDTDSAFTQVAHCTNGAFQDLWSQHDVMFTFAELLGEPHCRVPDAGYSWKHTRQPVHLPFWNEVTTAPGGCYTTVMNWDAYGFVEWQGERWGQKNAEFPLIRDLPSRTGLEFELALRAPDDVVEDLRGCGWSVVDPATPTRTIWSFRQYIADSRGEITVNKQAFVRSHSGWFPERSANYLAAGRASIVQDTGWTEVLPSGAGLLAFTTEEEALAAVRAVEADPSRHGRAARQVAAEHFDARKVLTQMLSDAGVD
jgi:hypothetical protein